MTREKWGTESDGMFSEIQSVEEYKRDIPINHIKIPLSPCFCSIFQTTRNAKWLRIMFDFDYEYLKAHSIFRNKIYVASLKYRIVFF